MRLVVLERPGEDDGHLALRRDALLDGLLDHAAGRCDAEVPPCLARAGGRKTREVGLDERLDGVGREAADEDEREGARVGEPCPVERHRLLEAPPVDGRGRLRLPPRAVPAERVGNRLLEHDAGARHLIGEEAPGLRGQGRERGRVGARLGEPQVDELEQRFEILRSAPAPHALIELIDERPDADRFTGEDPVEHHVAEPADASRGHDHVRHARGEDVGIIGERRPPRREGAEQNLIFLQRRRLEDDRGAVGQRPLGDPGLRADRGLHDRAWCRRLVHQGVPCVGVHVGLERLHRGLADDFGELCLVGQGHAGGFRRRHHDEPVALGKPVGGEGVDLGERDFRKEPPVERELLPDRRQRLSLEEVPRVLVGAARGLAVRALGDHALVGEHPRLLRARELGRREAEPRHPLELGHQRVETALDAVARDHRLQDGLVVRPRRLEQRPGRVGLDERGVLSLRELIEPEVEHAAEQLVEHDVAIPADRALVARRPKVGEGDDGGGGFLVRDDRVPRAGMLRHVERRSRSRGHGRGQGREPLLDHVHDGVAIDVAHHDHGRQVRTVPVAIEPRELVALDVLDDLWPANGRSIPVARPFELHAADLLRRALPGPEVHPPFRQDDPPLLVDASLVERRGVRPVLEDEQRAVEGAGDVGRNAQRVLRVVVARRRIRVRTDAHAERRQEVLDALPREVLGAFELHVLDEVRHTPLVVVFQHRTGLDDQTQLGPVGRSGVRPHVVAQAVRQTADGDLRIHRHLLRQAIGSDRGGGGLAPGLRGLG